VAGGLCDSRDASFAPDDPGLVPPDCLKALPIPIIDWRGGGALLSRWLGLWDDVYKLEPWMKIGGRFAAAHSLLWDGIGIVHVAPMFDFRPRWRR